MAAIRVTQELLEVLTVNTAALSLAGSAVRVAQILLEILTAGTPSAFTSLTGQVLLFLSATQVPNAIGKTQLTVSAAWSLSGGASTAYSYVWSFSNVSNQAGFVSTATTSHVTRTWQVGGGDPEHWLISTTAYDASNTSVVSVLAVYPRARQQPDPYDGKVIWDSQNYCRIYPN